MATELTKVTFPTGDYIDISSKVSKSGDTMTGMLTVPKTKIAKTCYGVSCGRTTAAPVETILKTGIKWVSGSHMPVIHVTGYAYGLFSPVEFKIGFYIYADKIGYCGSCNMGSWEPELYLFKYTRNSVNYVAVGFKGSCYFLQLQADVQDEMGNLSNIILDDANWSWEFYTDTGHIPATDGGTTCCSVPYKANILNGIRNVSINGNYLRVNNNGTNTDLTIPYATSATTANSSKYITSFRGTIGATSVLDEFKGDGIKYANVQGNIASNYGDGLVIAIPWSGNANYAHQLYFDDSSYICGHRSLNNGTWSDWKKFIDESNYTDYTVKKDGTGASGTWGISISGNADTATTASKLGSSNVGSATNPIYLNGGTATACTYTLGKSVPSDAVFTDTDEKVTQTPTSTNADYRVLFSGTADSTTRTEGARKDSNLLYNPSSNRLELKNTGTSTSMTPSSISLSNSGGGGISIDNTNNQIEVGKSGTSITYSNTDVVTSNGNTWDGTNTSLKSALAAAVGTDEKVTQTEVTTDANFRILFSNSANNTTEIAGVGKDSGLIYNPSTGSFGHGYNPTISGLYAHAEGANNSATGSASHAEGNDTIAKHACQHVFGAYNIEDPSTSAVTKKGNYIEIVGNGTGTTSLERSNARTLGWDGTEWLAGNLNLGGTTSDIVLTGTNNTWDGNHTSLKGALTPEVVTSSTVNLNNYTSSGKYILTGSITTKTNFPVLTPGQLEVTTWSESSTEYFCRQEFKIYDVSYRFQNDSFTRMGRSSDGGTTWVWGTWGSDQYFIAGETFKLGSGYSMHGHITSSTSRIYIYTVLPKSLRYVNITKPTSTISMDVRQNGKYVQANPYSFTIDTLNKFGDAQQPCGIEIGLKNANGTALTNGTNNDTVSAQLRANLTLSFTARTL